MDFLSNRTQCPEIVPDILLKGWSIGRWESFHGSKRLEETWFLVLALRLIDCGILGRLLNLSGPLVSLCRWGLGGPCLYVHLYLAFIILWLSDIFCILLSPVKKQNHLQWIYSYDGISLKSRVREVIGRMVWQTGLTFESIPYLLLASSTQQQRMSCLLLAYLPDLLLCRQLSIDRLS